MAYQPVQVGNDLGGFNRFFETMRAAKQQQDADNARRAELLLRQRQQDSLEQERQRRLTNEQNQRQLEGRTAVMQALDAGRPDLARQYAQAYGINLGEQVTKPAQDPGDTLMKPSTVANTEPVAGPVPSSEDMALATFSRNANSDAPLGSLPGQIADAEAGRQQFEQDQKGMSFLPGGLEKPKAEQRAYSINGQTYDHLEARRVKQEEIARNVEQQRAAFSGFGDKYGNLAAGLAAGADPKLSPVIAAAMEKDTAREASVTEKNNMREFNREEHRLNRQQSDENNRRIAAAMGARAGIAEKEATSNLNAAKFFSDEYGKFQREAGLPQDAKDFRQLNDAVKLARTGNALAQRKAAFNLGRSINGPGVFTDKDRTAILGNISGVLGAAETWMQRLLSGEMGDRERAVVAEAVELQLKQVQSRIDGYDQAARQRFGPDSEFADVQNLFENRHRAFLQQFGRGEDLQPRGGSELLIGSKQAMDRRNRSRADKFKNKGKDSMDRALELLK